MKRQFSLSSGPASPFPSKWEAARDLIAQNWVTGTEKSPDVKLWIATAGRNYRAEPERGLVYRV